MFYKHDLNLKLIKDYKNIIKSFNPMFLQFHIEALSSKGIDIDVIESTFLDHQNPKYTKYYGLTFDIVPNMDIYDEHIKLHNNEEQIEKTYQLYNEYISKTQASDFVENNLPSFFTTGTYDKETFTKIERNSRGSFVNVDNLVHFYRQLCIYSLGNYEYKCITKGVVIFKKKISSNYVFSIKYSESDFKKDLKLGHIRFPALEFWISDKLNQKDFFLGIIEHPFNKGMLSPDSYLASTLVIKVDYASYEIMRPVELIDNEDSCVIILKESLNLNLKKCLTQYLNFENPFKKSILNYYEELAKEIIKEDNLTALNFVVINNK